MIPVDDLFDYSHTIAGELFKGLKYPWEVLPKIAPAIPELAKKLGSDYSEIKPGVWVGKDVKIDSTAVIQGPAIIGPRTKIGPGAWIRENVIMGADVFFMHAVEAKNCIIFDNAEVPHYNYVGDSVMGYRSHTGAGVILSNFRIDRKNIVFKMPDGTSVPTGLLKIGAFLGDRVEIGSNAVCNPVTIIGRDTMVYPLTSVRGLIPSNSIVKKSGEIIKKI